MTVPRRTRDEDVDAFLEEKRGWIERQVAAIAARQPRLGLGRPGVVWLGGEAVPVARVNGRRSVARLAGGRLVVAGASEQAGAAVTRWYRREARTTIGEAADREAGRLGLEYRSIGIRDQRTR